MKNHLKAMVLILVSAFFLNAQIVNRIEANINHSFLIGNNTLPPGQYTFRMVPESELALMTVTDQNGKTIEFRVHATTANHSPRHSELVFRKYGDTEILTKIFEKGLPDGSEVVETNKQEASLAKQGRAIEHSEEQK
jgi:hypothetical protein